MGFDDFTEMRLAGGTALALQIGHRKSIDLDLFGDIDFDNVNTVKVFADFHNTITLKKSKNINIFSIDDIKVDFVNYSYPWLQQQLLLDGIRLAGIEDIAAMKLAAITGRGSRKDFIDLYFLLQKYSLKKMLSFYKEKYFDAKYVKYSDTVAFRLEDPERRFFLSGGGSVRTKRSDKAEGDEKWKIEKVP